MTHDYKYENLSEEDRNGLIPACRTIPPYNPDPKLAEAAARLQEQALKDWNDMHKSDEE